MQHHQQFIHGLIELRSHYQLLQNEYEQSLAHVQQQLSHVNALLVDQMVEQQQLVENLMEMRSHYQALYEEQQQKVANAREQLDRVNMLLADQLVLQYSEQHAVSIPATAVEEKHKVLTETTENHQQELPQTSLAAATHTLRQQQEQPQTEQKLEELVPRDTLEPNLSSGASAIEAEEVESTEAPDAAQTVEISDEVKVTKERSHQLSLSKRPLLPQYASVTKQQAVEQVLREHAGEIVDIEFMIYSLHGQLDPEAAKEEKSRMYDILKKGAKKGLWDKVPDSPGCYTFDLKLIASSEKKEIEKNKRQGQKFRGKNSDQLLPRYQNMTFTDAVEEIVRENAGQVLSIDKVTQELYGHQIKGYALTKAKGKVGKTLWHGASLGRWQRVPKKLGEYTLNLQQVDSGSQTANS